MSKDKQNQNDIEPVEADVLKETTEQHAAAAVENEEKATEEQPKAVVEETQENELEDDPTAVKLTVLVVCTQLDSKLLRYALRSLQNLRGIDAVVKVTGTEKPSWLAHEDFIFVDNATNMFDTISGALKQIESKRIILMTDHNFILNPVSLADIAINKANPEPPKEKSNAVKLLKEVFAYDGRIEDYATSAPLYAYKEPLESVLDEMEKSNIIVEDIATVYCNLMYRDVKPLYLNWRNDPWIIPIVTEKPSKSVVMDYVKRKKFLYMQRCNEHLLDILATLFPTPCEAEIPDENLE